MDDPDMNVERIALKISKAMKNKQANEDIPYPLSAGERVRGTESQAFLNSFSIASFAGFTYISLSLGFSTFPAGLRGMLA